MFKHEVPTIASISPGQIISHDAGDGFFLNHCCLIPYSDLFLGWDPHQLYAVAAQWKLHALSQVSCGDTETLIRGEVCLPRDAFLLVCLLSRLSS